MIKQAVIIGCGGHARVVGATLHVLNIPIKGYLDSAYIAGADEEIKYGKLIGTPDDLQTLAPQAYSIYTAIGDGESRRLQINTALQHGFELPALIHPKSLIETDCDIGIASHICIGAILSAEVKIGKGVIINTGSSIDHESVIGDYTHIAPKVVIAGRVKIGMSVFVGIGACIAQNITVGNGALIGAGAIVLKDVPPNTRVLGVYH